MHRRDFDKATIEQSLVLNDITTQDGSSHIQNILASEGAQSAYVEMHHQSFKVNEVSHHTHKTDSGALLSNEL